MSTLAPSRPWRTAVLAGMASYLDGAAITTTGSAMILFQAELGLTPEDIGLVSGLLTITFGIGAFFGGRLGDRFGRRRVFTLSIIAYAIGAAVLAGAQNISMIIPAVVLLGLSIGADLPVSLALAAEEAPEGKKGRMVSLSGLLWMAGATIPGLATAGLGTLGSTGARILYLHMLVVAIAVIILRRTTRESAEWQRARQLEVRGSEDIKFSHVPQLFKGNIGFAFLTTTLFLTLVGLAGNTLGSFSIFIFTNILGIPVSQASLFGLATLPVALITLLILFKVADKRYRNVFVYIGAVSLMLAFVLPAVAGVTATTIFVSLVLVVIGGSWCGEYMYRVWAQEIFPTLLRTTAQGLAIGIQRLVIGVAAIWTPLALMLDAHASFIVLALTTGVGAAIAAIWIPRLPKAQDIESEPTVRDADMGSTIETPMEGSPAK